MTRRLTRLADISYRRRGRVVLIWIVAMFVIIGVGSSLAGEFQADYDTPGSESKAASDITEQRFAGYSGQEVYVVAKEPTGFANQAEAAPATAFFVQAEKVEHISAHTPIRLSQNRQIAIHHASDDRPRLGGHQGPGHAADQRRRGQRRQWARDQARRRSDLRRAVPIQPGGLRVPGRRDRAADRLRLNRRGRAASWNRPGRPRDLLGRTDPTAGQRHGRARLDHRRLRTDRDRRRHRLLAPGPHPLPLGDEGRQGSPRRGRRGRHDCRAQRDHRRLPRS